MGKGNLAIDKSMAKWLLTENNKFLYQRFYARDFLLFSGLQTFSHIMQNNKILIILI